MRRKNPSSVNPVASPRTWLTRAGSIRPSATGASTSPAWRRHNSAVRPHGILNCLTPHAFKQQHQPPPNGAILQM